MLSCHRVKLNRSGQINFLIIIF